MPPAWNFNRNRPDQHPPISLTEDPLLSMEGFLLERAMTVHLKPGGEVCNRLSRGVRVYPVQRKGNWLKIQWRGGKKKGWIFLPHPAA